MSAGSATEPTDEMHPNVLEWQRNRDNQDRRTLKQLQACLCINMLFGTFCVVVGVLIRHNTFSLEPSWYSGGNLRLTLDTPYLREALLLLLNLSFVKLSVWSSGRVHEMTLKWSLADENDELTGKMRLEFNTNLRFLQSSQKWRSANGLPANIVMALCLTISYAASSMVLLGMERENRSYNTILSFVALYVLGSATLVQSTIAFLAICTTRVLTWNQSPLVTAHTLLLEGRLTKRPGRCMHALYDLHRNGPRKPRVYQESLWKSHPHFRKFTMYIWMIVAGGYYWFFIIWGMMKSGTQGSQSGDSWNPIPSSELSNSGSLPKSKITGLMNFGWEGEAPAMGLLWGLGILVGFQGGMLTTALTCSESISHVVSDERLWREAGEGKGSDPRPGLFKRIFISGHTMFLFLIEPVFHWLFGLAVGFSADTGFQIRPVQILYVSLAGTAFAIELTAAGILHRPRTSQPSTYGHLQTLVDLVDEWHEKMHWGHKWPGHAGTSDRLLEDVNPDKEYGFGDRADC